MTGPVVRGQQVRPGDVLVCEGTAPGSKLIEIGAILTGDIAASHVAIYHHADANGTHWAIEGRPGGVGWQQAGPYCQDPRTVTNALQPKTASQRTNIAKFAEGMLGVPYDWQHGIFEDAWHVLNLPDIWKPEAASGQIPGAVVCSSLAAWVYDRAGLAAPHPGDWRHVTPGAWALFVAEQGWGPT